MPTMRRRRRPEDSDRDGNGDGDGDGDGRNGPPATDGLGAPEVVDPIGSAIDTVFRNDRSARDAMRKNLREGTEEPLSHRVRSADALANFTASRFSADERARPTYLAPGDDLTTSLEIVAVRAAEKLAASSARRSVKLRPTDDLLELISDRDDGDGAVVGKIDLGGLIDFISPDAAIRPTQTRDPDLTACLAAREAESRMEEIHRSADPEGHDDEDSAEPAPTPHDEDGHDGRDDGSSAADELVARGVDVLMSTATSPETRLHYAVPARSDADTLEHDISTFELRAGPSDVTSYHDFSSLQIAFEDVWTEVFDGQLASLGQELYQEYVRLRVYAGLDDRADRPIDTLDDLSGLLDEIRELGRMTQEATPGEFSDGADETGEAPVDPAAAIGNVKTFLDPFSLVSDSISDDTVRTLVDPVGATIDAIGRLLAGKPQLTWASFPGPLPVNGDIIRATFEEDVVPAGTVEIVLTNSPEAWWWKGIEFREFDATGKEVCIFRISNDARDADVWDAGSHDRLPLYTGQVTNALLEFKKAAPGLGFGVRTGYYLLAGLDQRLKDRMRVTFSWDKDN